MVEEDVDGIARVECAGEPARGEWNHAEPNRVAVNSEVAAEDSDESARLNQLRINARSGFEPSVSINTAPPTQAGTLAAPDDQSRPFQFPDRMRLA